MRRSDREITAVDEMVEVMKKCDVCRLALNDDGYPYIVPLNFGMDYSEGVIRLYFHSASEGYKTELMQKDNRASFEMDCGHELQYFEEKGYCTMAYESVIGRGRIHILEEDEKAQALTKLMEQYHPDGKIYYNPAAIKRTLVYCLTVEQISGKRKKAKKN